MDDDVLVHPPKVALESMYGTEGLAEKYFVCYEFMLEDYTWHCNRHTFASRLVMAGVDLRTVAQLVGHKTIQMTMRYAHLAPDHQQDAVERLVTPSTLTKHKNGSLKKAKRAGRK